VQADFLYGAPASGLTVEGDLRVGRRSRTLPGLQQVSFGLEAEREKFEPPLITLSAPRTPTRRENRRSRMG